MNETVFVPRVSILHKAVIHCAVLRAANGLILLHHRSCWWCVGVGIVYVPPNRFKAINFSCHYIFSLPLSAEFRIASETGAGGAGLPTPQPSNSKTQGLQFLVVMISRNLQPLLFAAASFENAMVQVSSYLKNSFLPPASVSKYLPPSYAH